MNISIIGNGYVGLVVAVGLASKGQKVICVDTDKAKVRQINHGESPIHEANLDTLLRSCVNEKDNLKASLDYNEILNSDITFICVDTPCDSDGSVDLSHITHSATEIGGVLAKANNYHIVVVKSTVIPGTTEGVIIPILEEYSFKKAGKDFGVVVNPEFLQEGKALHNFLNPDRIIIGEHDPRASDMLEEIYRHFPAPILRTDMKTAEMIKYASNAFLATKISFINEIGNICKKLGIDAYEVARGMGYDPRIGNQFLDAGVGFGGSCLPKDLQALVSLCGKMGYRPHLLESVLEVNRAQAVKMVEMVERKLGGLENKKIAVLGLAFKPNTDDVRDAPALKVIKALLQKGALVKAYDPEAVPNAKEAFPESVEYCDSAQQAIDNSDCILVLTEWDEFKDEGLYKGKVVMDGRRVLDPQKAKAICDYQGLCW